MRFIILVLGTIYCLGCSKPSTVEEQIDWSEDSGQPYPEALSKVSGASLSTVTVAGAQIKFSVEALDGLEIEDSFIKILSTECWI